VLEQHGLAVEADLCRLDQPHKLLELVRVCRWQFRAAGVVELTEYQSVAFRERAKSHLHIEIRRRPDYAPRFWKKAKSAGGNPVRFDEDVGPAHFPCIPDVCGDS
jgi:hypothetical protein